MSEDQIDVTANEPKTYGSESLFVESLDPPPPPDSETFGSDHAGIEQAAAERSRTAAERNVVDVLQFNGTITQATSMLATRWPVPSTRADQLKAFREQKALAEQQALMLSWWPPSTRTAVRPPRKRWPRS